MHNVARREVDAYRRLCKPAVLWFFSHKPPGTSVSVVREEKVQIIPVGNGM